MLYYYYFILDIFNNEYNKIQMVYKKLDEQLLKSNAYQAQKFIKITQNTIKKYKNQPSAFFTEGCI